MGCDIHLAAEVLNDDKWEYVDPPIEVCEFCKGTGIQSSRFGVDELGLVKAGLPCWACANENLGFGIGKPGWEQRGWYHDRNYRVFSVLADVRNYHDRCIVPISEPRGLPEDVTPESLDRMSHEHSATWLDLVEVMAYDWTSIGDAGDYFLERMKMLAGVTGERRCRLVFDFDS
jgi:hypothetical protein